LGRVFKNRFYCEDFSVAVSQCNFCGAIRVKLKVIYARRNAIIGNYDVNSRGAEFKFEKPPKCNCSVGFVAWCIGVRKPGQEAHRASGYVSPVWDGLFTRVYTTTARWCRTVWRRYAILPLWAHRTI